jgi:hypothetical protein
MKIKKDMKKKGKSILRKKLKTNWLKCKRGKERRNNNAGKDKNMKTSILSKILKIPKIPKIPTLKITKNPSKMKIRQKKN